MDDREVFIFEQQQKNGGKTRNAEPDINNLFIN